ncbi:uncharacterized protein LOC103316332 isoform X1 [Nasonia vitripennis]|uniref:CHK kinase-like domain-containing protein n=1 Tax=Nasonia vitripennis TaxID=7425 RepID=A0A7M7R4W2_NASVI|nr:uncharacterized protein LOC103316332 isoform X1 [Nasonia vitripennis]
MSQIQTIVLRDLQSLLRETIGSEIEVVNYETSNLLPKGEQYGSTMLKVEASVKKKSDSPEEKMHFVAKMLPTAEFQQEHLNMTDTFTKEIYIVQKLSEIYRELEREAGIKEENLIDVFPRFCGGRLSRKKDTIDVADEDAVMLLENLKVRGYDMIDRLTGLNYEHAKLVMTKLAHFHALGTALKMKKPKLFESVKKLINTKSFGMKEEEFQQVLNYFIQILCEDPRINQYKDRVKKVLTRSKDYDSFLGFQDIEPWISIGHGDFWKNNILFHYGILSYV